MGKRFSEPPADKKGKLKNTGGNTLADESTYEMIMKNKEGLLTFYDEKKHHTAKANKIRFIFFSLSFERRVG